VTVLYYTAGLLNTAVCHLAIFTLAQSAQFVLLRGFFSVFFTNTLSCHAAVAVMQLTTMPLFFLLSLLFLEKMSTHYKSRIVAVYPLVTLNKFFTPMWLYHQSPSILLWQGLRPQGGDAVLLGSSWWKVTSTWLMSPAGRLTTANSSGSTARIVSRYFCDSSLS